MKDRIVLALGGNALQRPGGRGSWEEAVERMRRTAPAIAELAAAGHEIALCHGNGPQVGALLRATELAASEVPPRPLDVLVAESEGQIGYLIQQELSDALAVAKVERTVFSMISRMEVARRDPAFRTPTKPIGSLYTEEQARRLRKTAGWTIVPDAGRGGWRRVVPSPRPVRWIEGAAVRSWFDSGLAKGAIPIVAGGGGIPVVRAGGRLEGVEAVLDKDLAASLVAREIGAKRLVIVTDVPGIAVGYGTKWEQWLGAIRLDVLERWQRSGEFPVGSMGPKVEAGIDFLKSGGREFIVTDIPSLGRALAHDAGTRVQANA
ncbi:MAG: carbamate kinase [Thermoplasmata archaeon]